MKKEKKKYSYYACYKNNNKCGVVIGPEKNPRILRDALLSMLDNYAGKNTAFVGIVRCCDGDPFSKICDPY